MLQGTIRRLRSGVLPEVGDVVLATRRYGVLLGTFGLTCANPLTAVVLAGFLARVDGPINVGNACGMGAMGFFKQPPCAIDDRIGRFARQAASASPVAGVRREHHLARRPHCFRAFRTAVELSDDTQPGKITMISFEHL